MMDLSTNLPEQEGKYIDGKKYSCFGYSLRGSSHIAMKMPCQDYNNFEYLKDCGAVIACIADGVGSCPLSHWGAFTAVETAMKFVKEQLEQLCHGRTLSLAEHRKDVPGILKEAFQKALDAVEDFAEENGRPVSAFFSTLTFALYDGKVLCCEHAGDDGVVAQFQRGKVEMVTERIKGEEANSVYPLQSGPAVWKYSEAGLDDKGPVVAFTMVTDGVLDKFVFEGDVYKKTEGCCHGVYYPFMAPMVYGDPEQKLDAKDASQKMQYFLEKMNREKFRRQITDDLTLVSVVNLRLMEKSIRPVFRAEAFQFAGNMIREQQRKLLYGTGRSSGKTEESTEMIPLKSEQEADEKKTKSETIEIPGSASSDSDGSKQKHSNDEKPSFFPKTGRGKGLIKNMERNEFLFVGMASVILVTGILIGVLGCHIAGKIRDGKSAEQETEAVISTAVDEEFKEVTNGEEFEEVTGGEEVINGENTDFDETPEPTLPFNSD